MKLKSSSHGAYARRAPEVTDACAKHPEEICSLYYRKFIRNNVKWNGKDSFHVQQWGDY